MKKKSFLFVILQFGLLILIALFGSVIEINILIVVQIFAVLLGFYAVAYMKFLVNIFPETTQYSKLKTGGPYSFIRHPMYSALLLISFVWMINAPNLFSILFWILLFVNLYLKSDYEEELLTQRFAEYSYYKSKTKKFVPGII